MVGSPSSPAPPPPPPPPPHPPTIATAQVQDAGAAARRAAAGIGALGGTIQTGPQGAEDTATAGTNLKDKLGS